MKMWNCKLLVLLLDIWMVTSITENQIASVIRVVFHLSGVINRSFFSKQLNLYSTLYKRLISKVLRCFRLHIL